MFDLRYHVASLAAVFLALAIGILLGVAISGKVSSARNSVEAAVVNDLRTQLTQERARNTAERQRSEAATELNERAYPALMDGRLRDRRIAVVFLGTVDRSLLAGIEKTLTDAGSGAPLRTVALNLPVEPQRLDGFLAGGDETLAAYVSRSGDFADLGRALGRELMGGGDVSLLTKVSSQLIEQRSGTPTEPVDGAVIVASWQAPATDSVASPQTESTESLVDGVLQGFEDAGLPVVGVESSTSPDTATDVFRSRGIASVDDVDLLTGRVALAVLLSEGVNGHYGLKPSATDGIVPPIPPLPAQIAPAG